MNSNFDLDLDLDIALDFRSDVPSGKDPDTYSPALRNYHKFLWSKPLPNGGRFELDDTTSKYLYYQPDNGGFPLSSDSMFPTFSYYQREPIAGIIKQIPTDELKEFVSLTYTIGGMIIFPSNKIDRKPTLNGARGLNGKVRDRFDLTLECIRRYYRNETSPLNNSTNEVLTRYKDFFGLFGDFQGYVDFFLLNDMVTEDYSAVKFFTEFKGFDTVQPLPQTLEEYREYRRLTIEAINKRGCRMLEFCMNREF